MSTGQDRLGVLRYWLRDRRILILAGLAVIIGAAALNWGWLVALGVAPILLAVAPCGIMCAIGLCSMGGRKGGAANAANPSAGGDGSAPVSQVMSGASAARRE